MEAAAQPVIDHPVSFAHPPVNEVVLSVQFARPIPDDVLALADFWPKIREDFPNLERQPPIMPASEDFSSPPRQPPFRFEFGEGAMPQRYWLVSEEGNDLVQFQRDRFLVNWRRQGSETPYPRYDHIRKMFTEIFPVFQESLAPQDKAGLEPEWCEITYINEIDAEPDSGHGHMELGRILRLFQHRVELEALPPPEDAQFQERFVLRRDESPFGRFYLNATPAFRSTDGKAVYMVTLLVRGSPQTTDSDGALALFDLGHDQIVRTFRDMTTDEMHDRWGLEKS